MTGHVEMPDPILVLLDEELVRLDEELGVLQARRDRTAEARSVLVGAGAAPSLGGRADPPAAPAPTTTRPAKKATAKKPASKPRKKTSPKTKGSGSGGVHVCECGRECATGTGLAAHRRFCVVALGTPATTDAPPPASVADGWVCTVCDESFVSQAARAAHRRQTSHLPPADLTEGAAA